MVDGLYIREISRSKYLLLSLALCRQDGSQHPAGGGACCPRLQMHRMCLFILLCFGKPMLKGMGALHLALFRIFRLWTD